MSPEALPPEAWVDEGRRAAPALQDVAAAIVTGRDPEATAAVALGLARAHARERRVAVADLVGGIPALTPLGDQPGLYECLRDGTPVSGIGQPDGEEPNVYLLPAGLGPIAERWVFESARWDKLVAGFREVDALLLLVAQPYAPGLDVLVGRVDGVVAVDLPPAELRRLPLLATIDHPEPELPPIVTGPEGSRGVATGAQARRGGRKIGRYVMAALLAVALGFGWWKSRFPAGLDGPSEVAVATEEGAIDGNSEPEEQAGDAAAAETAALEVSLGPVVNPGDSAIAAGFAVELVAANTLASANSSFAFRSGPAPVPTVSPVLLGSGSRPWYRAVVGAWTDRRDAESWLAARRASGELRQSAGRVVGLPLALLMEEGIATGEAAAAVARWERAIGVPAYAMLQDDGRVRVFAGAFETAGQAAWLAGIVREAGFTPQLAYRTGRAF